MNRLSKNSKYENRYLLTEEISYDPKSGNQVWAVTDTETEKRLIGRFQGNGKVEWFDDTRPKSKAISNKIEEKLPNILPSISSISKSTEKLPAISIPTIPQNSKPIEKAKPFSIPISNNNSTTSPKINTINTQTVETKENPLKKSKVPIYIGLSFMILILALIGYNKKEWILSKMEHSKVNDSKVDSTVVDTLQEKVLMTPPSPNLQNKDIEPPIVKNEDTLKQNIDSTVKINELKNESPPKKVKRRKEEKTPKNGGFIKL